MLLNSCVALSDPLALIVPGQFVLNILSLGLQLLNSDILHSSRHPARPIVLKVNLTSFLNKVSPSVMLLHRFVGMNVHHLLLKRVDCLIVIWNHMYVYRSDLLDSSRQPAEPTRVRIHLNDVDSGLGLERSSEFLVFGDFFIGGEHKEMVVGVDVVKLVELFVEFEDYFEDGGNFGEFVEVVKSFGV